MKNLKNIMKQYNLIKKFRKTVHPPVDTLGCEQIFSESPGQREQRKFLLLTSLLLSVQTNDKITYKLMHKINNMDFTPQKVTKMTDTELEDVFSMTNFRKKKAQYVKNVASIALKGKLPETLKEITKIKGIGNKIGLLYMQVGFGIVDGISVDTHCHRFKLF